MSEPTLQIFTNGRKAGRPRVPERLLPVSSALPMKLYDELAKRAIREGKSVSSLVREAVSAKFDIDLSAPRR